MVKLLSVSWPVDRGWMVGLRAALPTDSAAVWVSVRTVPRFW